MKRLLLLPLLLLFSTPVLADLGQAEDTKYQKNSYVLRCGRENGKKCTITFDGERLRVDGGVGITKDQVIYIRWMPCERAGFAIYCTQFRVNYKKEDGTLATGKFFLMKGLKGMKQFGHLVEKFELFSGKKMGSPEAIVIEENK